MKGYLSLTFQDIFGQNTIRQYELADGTGTNATTRLNSLRTRSLAMIQNLEQLTGLKIVNTALVVTDIEYLSPNNPPANGSNVSDDGVLRVVLSGGGKGYVRVPSPLHSLVNSSGAPDITKIEWGEFISLFYTGGGFNVSDGELVQNQPPNGGILKTWRASRGRRNS
jgi:hypothetical protein